MADIYSPQKRSEIMRKIKGKNTMPEKIVSRVVKELGYSITTHRKDIPGTPDITVDCLLRAILVNGCFWHHHKGCKYAYQPKTNRKFWLKKIKGNVARDRRKKILLSRMGWRYLVIWECEVCSLDKLRWRIKRFLDKNENSS